MDMRALAEMMAPNTTAQIDRVKRKPTPGEVMGLPFSLVGDVARPALSVVDEGLGALSGIGQEYPGIGNFVGALQAGTAAAQGDPYYQQRSNLIDAQAGTFGANARKIGAQADLVDNQAALLGMFAGGDPIGGLAQPAPGPWAPGVEPMQGGGGMPGISDQMLAAMTLGGMGEQSNSLRQLRSDSRSAAQSAAEREAFGRLWSPEQIEKRRADLTRQFAPMQDLTRARAAIESTPVEGLSVPILVTALQQQLEPGLAVRQEDVRMLTEGALSGAELTMGDVMKWVDENALAPKMVPKLKEFALRMLGAREDLYADMFENVLNEKDALKMTDYGLRRSTPFWESGHEAIQRRDARRNTPAPSEVPEYRNLRSVPIEEARSALAEIESAHPEWSDEQIRLELRKRFGIGE